MPRQRGRVWLVDDYPAFVDITSRWLTGFGYEVRPFVLGNDLLAAYEPGPPECLLLDVRLPDVGWLELLHGVRKLDPFVPVLLITGMPDVEIAVAALKEGVHDFLTKPIESERLHEVVQGALDVSESRAQADGAAREARRRLQRLTAREREVLELLVEGSASKVIAERLGCSKKTVDVHRSAILRKFDVDNVVELVRLYLLTSDRGPGQVEATK